MILRIIGCGVSFIGILCFCGFYFNQTPPASWLAIQPGVTYARVIKIAGRPLKMDDTGSVFLEQEMPVWRSAFVFVLEVEIEDPQKAWLDQSKLDSSLVKRVHLFRTNRLLSSTNEVGRTSNKPYPNPSQSGAQ